MLETNSRSRVWQIFTAALEEGHGSGLLVLYAEAAKSCPSDREVAVEVPAVIDKRRFDRGSLTLDRGLS